MLMSVIALVRAFRSACGQIVEVRLPVSILYGLRIH